MIYFLRHSASQNRHAIRNGERCDVRLCGISPNTNFKEIGFAELKVPYKRVHTTRSFVGSLCFTE